MGERTAPASAIPISFPAMVIQSPVRIIRAPRGSPASLARFIPGPLLVLGHTVRWLPRRHYVVHILRIGLLLRSRLFRVGVFHRAEMAVFPGSLTEGGSGPGTHNKKQMENSAVSSIFVKQASLAHSRQSANQLETFPTPPRPSQFRRRLYVRGDVLSVSVFRTRKRARTLDVRYAYALRSSEGNAARRTRMRVYECVWLQMIGSSVRRALPPLARDDVNNTCRPPPNV